MEEKIDQTDAVEARGATKWSWRRIVPLALLALMFVLFFTFDLNDYVSYDAVKAHDVELRDYVAAHYFIAMITYVLVYTLVIACSLPGGLVLTILGGYLFGTAVGGSLTIVGATIGATLIFLAAKTALGDLLRSRAGPVLQRMEAGFRKNAFNYLLVLRLVPLFPFFLVNLAPAFLGVPLRTYVAATFLGIIPATFIFSSVGNGLGTLLAAGREPGAGIIMRPEILLPLLGLALLALLPVLYRWFKKRRAPLA